MRLEVRVSSRKGQKKKFDSGVIVAILSGEAGPRLDTKKPVDMGDVAEVNEHLFPRSGMSMGLLVGAIAIKKSRPEIRRQCAALKGIRLARTTPERLIALLGKTTSLACTGL